MRQSTPALPVRIGFLPRFPLQKDRIFEAPTNPDERLKWWWGAKGIFEITHVESYRRAGGKWKMRGTGMGDKPLTIAGEYRKIERPRLLVFIWVPDQQENATETLECVRRALEEKDGVYEDAPDVL